MKENMHRALHERKQKLTRRLENRQTLSMSPVLSARNLIYEVSGRSAATCYGGIGMIHQLARNLGLVDRINDRLHLFKVHQPYHESDHILNMVFNTLTGGQCLDDIEKLRNDPAYMDLLGAERIPDPTTAGDFLRRFEKPDIMQLMEIINEAGAKAISIATGGKKRDLAILDIDSTITPTTGERKEDMDISYDGQWGFHPLLITEAQTGTHLSIINRSGNEASQKDAGPWINATIQRCRTLFRHFLLRGDTAFSLTHEFDAWTEAGVQFVFGYDSTPKMREIVENLAISRWKRLWREADSANDGPPTAKEQRIIDREFRNLTLHKEYIAEFKYTPVACKKAYRVVAVKKIIREMKGQALLFTHTRYFFYITNLEKETSQEVLDIIMGRCNHENSIHQLKDGIFAMKNPTYGFLANWAYMLICALAWNLKSWLGLLFADRKWGDAIRRMEFKRFIRNVIEMPAVVIRSGRRLHIRLLNVSPIFEPLFATYERLQALPI